MDRITRDWALFLAKSLKDVINHAKELPEDAQEELLSAFYIERLGDTYKVSKEEVQRELRLLESIIRGDPLNA